MHCLKHRGEPGPPARSVAKRQKFVATRDRWRADQKNVLDIVNLQHVTSSWGSLHLIEHVRQRRLEFHGFLDFLGAHLGILAVFKSPRAMVIASKLDEAR